MQWTGDFGEDWCWKPGLTLGCNAEEECRYVYSYTVEYTFLRVVADVFISNHSMSRMRACFLVTTRIPILFSSSLQYHIFPIIELNYKTPNHIKVVTQSCKHLGKVTLICLSDERCRILPENIPAVMIVVFHLTRVHLSLIHI